MGSGIERSEDRETLEEWASHYYSMALLGFLCLLLGVSKHLATFIPSRLHITMPPAVLAGVLGALILAVVTPALSREMDKAVEGSIYEIKANLISFAYAGLILGFAAAEKNVPHTRAICYNIFHEALPLLVYSQVLMWGQTAAALFVGSIFRNWNDDVSPLLAPLVTLGLETGRDRVSYTSARGVGEWAHDVIRLADSVGTIVSIAAGIGLMSYRRWKEGGAAVARKSSMSEGEGKGRGGGGGGDAANVGAMSGARVERSSGLWGRISSRHGGGRKGKAGSEEHFQGRRAQPQSAIQMQDLQAKGKAGQSLQQLHQQGKGAGAGGGTATGQRGEGGSSATGGGGGADDDLIELLGGKGREAGAGRQLQSDQQPGGGGGGIGGMTAVPEKTVAGMGSHISLMAVAILLALLVDVGIRGGEEEVKFTSKHHIISGFRLFKISMCTSMFIICLLRRTTSVSYHSDWFFRLSGLCLDLMACAAISDVRFRNTIPGRYGAAFASMVAAVICWNVYCFTCLAPRMFPSHWWSGAVACLRDNWVGLLLVRAMDPQLRTPIPLAYAYRQMLFFIPGSEGKNSLVIGLIDTIGLHWTLAFCVCAAVLWMQVYNRFIKHRVPSQHQDASSAGNYSDLLPSSDLGTSSGSSSSSDDDSSGDLLGSAPSGGGGGGGGRAEGGEDEEVGDEADVTLLLSSPQKRAKRRGRPEGGGLSGGGGRQLCLEEPSKILTEMHCRKLGATVSPADNSGSWKLVYSLLRDGASLNTLLMSAMKDKSQRVLIVIEDSWGWKFGGFIANELEDSRSYYGTGESFVFAFNPTFQAFKWTGRNDYFCISHEDSLAMGGGGAGFAFQLDNELDRGESNASETYGNSRLSSNEFFRCQNVEVWSPDGQSFASL